MGRSQAQSRPAARSSAWANAAFAKWDFLEWIVEKRICSRPCIQARLRIPSFLGPLSRTRLIMDD